MIPKEFHGLPVHALAVHAAVVFVPLAALLAILFVVPRTRAWAALPMPSRLLPRCCASTSTRASGFNLKTHVAGLSVRRRSSTTRLWARRPERPRGLGEPAVLPDDRLRDHRGRRVPALATPGDPFSGTVQYAACAVLVVGALRWPSRRTGLVRPAQGQLEP